jgi:hypothetical protein
MNIITSWFSSIVLTDILAFAKAYYLDYIIITLFTLNFTWVWFTAIMRLQLMRKAGLLDVKRNAVMWYLAWLNLVIGLIADALLSVLLTIPMLDLPQWWKGEFLTTARLCRYYEMTPVYSTFKWYNPFATFQSWMDINVRKPFATWAGVVLLNDVDPSGQHIK